MKKKNFNLIMLLIFTCFSMSIFMNEYKAVSEYSTGIKILNYDYARFGNNVEVSWKSEYYEVDTETVLANDLLSDTDTLKPGEYYLLGVTLNYTGGLSKGPARAASIYYEIDTDIFEVIRDPDMEMDVIFDMRTVNEGGIFPHQVVASRRWQPDYDSATVNNRIVPIQLETGSVTQPLYFSSNLDQPFAFVLVKLKETATPGSEISFEFINDKFKSTETVYTNDDYDDFPITPNGITIKVYEEEEAKSTDNTLKEVKAVYNGTDYIATYDEAAKTYNIVVPNGASLVNLIATPNDTKATLISTDASETGISKTLNVGDNNYTVSVQAEDTTVALANYSIKVKRLDNQAELQTLTLSDITGFTFNPNTTSYNLTVPYKTTSTTVTATLPANSTATIKSGTGKWDLTNTGNTLNTKTVRVEAENCKDEYASLAGNTCTPKEYTINITRTPADTDSSLSSLEVKTSSTGTSYTMTPTFASGTTAYTVTVPYETTSVYIDASATSTLVGTITGTGNVTLTGDSTNADVVVTAESGAQTTYKITINKEISNNAYLTDLTIDGTTVTGFTKENGGPYTLSNTTSNSLTIGFTKENQYSTVSMSVNGTTVTGTTATLQSGNNTIVLTVTAQDKTTIKTYTVNVYKMSNNNNLQNLTVSTNPVGTMNPSSFNVNTKTYTYIYDESVTTATITATKGEPNQTITISSDPDGDGVINIADLPANKAVTITVTAEDGTTNTYTVNFSRKTSSDTTLKEVVLEYNDENNAKQSVTLTQSGNTFTGTVPYEAKIVTVKAVATSNEATVINGNGTWTLSNTGNTPNTRPVSVRAESGDTASYTLNVTRTPSNNNYLSDIKIDGTTINGFNKEITSYTVPFVKSTVSSLNLTYTKENEDATAVIVSGSNNLVAGNNKVVIRVTAQDGTQKDYEINVRKLSGDANITNLTIDTTPTNSANTLTKNTDTSYTYKYDRNSTSFTINPTLPTGAIISSDTKTTYTKAEIAANKTVTIKVLAEDTDISKEYQITFEQILETDAELNTLTVTNTENGTNYALSPTFQSSSSGPYSVTVPSDVEKVTITTTPKGSYTQSVTGDGEKTLTPGNNPVTITVTAEDGTTKSYTINITRELSKDTTIEDITITGKGENPDDDIEIIIPGGFTPENASYTLDPVPYKINKLDLNIIPTEGATVVIKKNGSISDGSLDVGDNTFILEVTSQDNTQTGQYTINVRRKSNDSKITSLTSSVGTVKTTNTNEYTIDVPSGTNTVDLTTVLSHPDAKIISPSSLTNIDVTSDITITVQAEDTSVEYNTTYTVKFNILESTNNYLGNLTVSEGVLTPGFDKEVNNYTVSVGKDIEKITITATPEDAASDVSGDTGEQTLKPGENTFNIIVTSESGEENTYTVVVTKEKKTDNTLSDITIDGTTIPGFDPSNPTYEITLPEGETTIEVGATPTPGSGATVSGTGSHTVSPGDTIVITVTAEDGSEKTYTITVKAPDPNNVTLDTLSVDGYTIDPTFNKDTLNYTIKGVDETTNTLTINATSSTPNAVISYQLDDNEATSNHIIDITNVESGKVKVLVTADGITKTYELTFDKNDNEDTGLDKITSGKKEDGVTDIHRITEANALNNGYILSGRLELLASDFKKEFKNTYDELIISNVSNEIEDTSDIRTGMTIKLQRNSVTLDEKLIVVKADINGSGNVDMIDANMILNHFLDVNILEGASYEAAKISNDDVVDMIDANMILNHFLDVNHITWE